MNVYKIPAGKVVVGDRWFNLCKVSEVERYWLNGREHVEIVKEPAYGCELRSVAHIRSDLLVTVWR